MLKWHSYNIKILWRLILMNTWMHSRIHISWFLARMNKELQQRSQFVVPHTCMAATALGNWYQNGLCRNGTEILHKSKLNEIWTVPLYTIFPQRIGVKLLLAVGIHLCHNIREQFCLKHLFGSLLDLSLFF